MDPKIAYVIRHPDHPFQKTNLIEILDSDGDVYNRFELPYTFDNRAYLKDDRLYLSLKNCGFHVEGGKAFLAENGGFCGYDLEGNRLWQTLEKDLIALADPKYTPNGFYVAYTKKGRFDEVHEEEEYLNFDMRLAFVDFDGNVHWDNKLAEQAWANQDSFISNKYVVVDGSITCATNLEGNLKQTISRKGEEHPVPLAESSTIPAGLYENLLCFTTTRYVKGKLGILNLDDFSEEWIDGPTKLVRAVSQYKNKTLLTNRGVLRADGFIWSSSLAELYALDLETRALEATGIKCNSFRLVDDKLIGILRDPKNKNRGQIRAYSPDNFKEVWRFSPPVTERPFSAGSLGKTIVIETGDSIYHFNKEGNLIWEIPQKERIGTRIYNI